MKETIKRSTLAAAAVLAAVGVPGCAGSPPPAIRWPPPPPLGADIDIPQPLKVLEGDAGALITLPVREEIVEALPLPSLDRRTLVYALPDETARVLGIDLGTVSSVLSLLPFAKGEASRTAAVTPRPGSDLAARFGDVLSVALLRRGFTGFVDERFLRPLTAREESKVDSGSLVLEAPLDRLALIRKIPGADLLLLVRKLEVENTNEEIEVPRKRDEKAIASYLRKLEDFEARVDTERQGLRRVVKQYRDQTIAAQREANVRLSTSPPPIIAFALKQDLAASQAELERVEREARDREARWNAAPSRREEAKRLAVSSDRANAQVTYARAYFTLVEPGTGQTMVGLQYERRDKTPGEALNALVEALADRLLSKSGLPPATVIRTGDTEASDDVDSEEEGEEAEEDGEEDKPSIPTPKEATTPNPPVKRPVLRGSQP